MKPQRRLAARGDTLAREIAAALRAEFAEQGVSYTELASRVGVSRQNISYALRAGVRTISTLMVLADAAGYDVVINFEPKQREAGHEHAGDLAGEVVAGAGHPR